MCDAHLVLAQAEHGLSCFFLPRFLDDGRRNAVHLQRLKDKVGNRSNASSEVEFDGATAWRLGEEERGVPVIIEMVRHTRLDCAIGSAGLIRAAAAQAHHASHRRAFGKRLVEQPLMQNVLADLALEAKRRPHSRYGWRAPRRRRRHCRRSTRTPGNARPEILDL
jgi:putative acyl-CoA dehydrogenase